MLPSADRKRQELKWRRNSRWAAGALTPKLKKERIREAGDGQERLLIFYYPSDDYRAWLMTVDELTFVDEIDCRDLFEGENDRERIMIYRIDY